MTSPGPADAALGPGVPRAVGRYELLARIAAGGMATVYLARARGLGGFSRSVAVKLCHPHLVADQEFATMFLDEARLAANIHHPNVVATLDVGFDDAALFLVMEYIDGERLSELVRAARAREEALPLPIAARVMVDALCGLHAAHEALDADGRPLGLIHRDVSPQNILVGVDGVARIVDFGIAKAEARATVTHTGQVKGKLRYMAPEQLAERPIGRTADVFAAGVVLWEALTGRALFRGDSDAETTSRLLHAPIDAPSVHRAGLSPELDAVVLAALARDPARRLPDAQRFADALERAAGRLATPREVAEFVRATAGDAIAQRHARLGDAASRAPAAAEPRESLSDAATRPPAAGAMDLHASAATAVEPRALEPMRRRGRVAAALGALGALVVVVAVLAPRVWPAARAAAPVAVVPASGSASPAATPRTEPPAAVARPAPQVAAPADPAPLSPPSLPGRAARVPAPSHRGPAPRRRAAHRATHRDVVAPGGAAEYIPSGT